MPVGFSMAWKTGAEVLHQIISLLPNMILGLYPVMTNSPRKSLMSEASHPSLSILGRKS